MNSPHPPDIAAADLPSSAHQLGRILNEGVTTSPYKYLLLLSLLDAVPRLPATPSSSTTLDIALLGDQALRILWPQTQPFRGQSLRKSGAAGDLEALRLVEDAQRSEPSLGRFLTRGSLGPARATAREGLTWLLAQWPLPRFQTVGRETTTFLWDVPPGWRERTTGRHARRPLPRSQFQITASGSPLLELLPDVPELLIRLAPLLRPLAEIRWTEAVARRHPNLVPQTDPLTLAAHLFPSPERSGATDRARPVLIAVHGRTCFWCGQVIRGSGDVDHVVPWSRTHNDAIENLVLSHMQCNATKLDRLLSRGLVDRYLVALIGRASELRHEALAAQIETDLGGTLLALRSILRFAPTRAEVFDVVQGAPVLRRSNVDEWGEVLSRWPVESVASQETE